MKLKKAPILGACVLTILLLCAPLVIKDESMLHLATQIMAWIIFAMGFDLVFGVTGLLSLGHAAFLGCGGYITSILLMSYGWSFLPALFAGGLFGALVALIFAILSLRVSGIYFALTTLALAQLVYTASATKLRFITGGVDGLAGVPRPELFGIDFYQAAPFYLFVACLFLLFLLISALIRFSPFGQVLQGIRLNEVRCKHVGFNVNAFKIGIYSISGFYSGVAGGIISSLIYIITPQIMQWKVSGDVVVMALLGGMGTLFGPVLGVIFFELLKEVLSAYTTHWYGILGLIFIFYTIFLPTGLMGLINTIWAKIFGKESGEQPNP